MTSCQAEDVHHVFFILGAGIFSGKLIRIFKSWFPLDQKNSSLIDEVFHDESLWSYKKVITRGSAFGHHIKYFKNSGGLGNL